MNTPLGLALLRDKRVALRSKLLALGAGVAVVELLQLPIESVVALILPVLGAAGDLAIDGAEVVLGPLVIASLLMPRLAPAHIVQQLREQRAGRRRCGGYKMSLPALLGFGLNPTMFQRFAHR